MGVAASAALISSTTAYNIETQGGLEIMQALLFFELALASFIAGVFLGRGLVSAYASLTSTRNNTGPYKARR